MTDYIRGWKGDGKKAVLEDREGNITVREGGSLAWRINNPGNLINGPLAKRHGSIGVYNPKTDNTFAVFPNPQTAVNAQKKLLEGPDYQKLTIAEAVAQYAPKDDKNNVPKYIRDIHDQTGLPINVTLNHFNESQMRALEAAFKVNESGHKMTSGTEVTYPAGSPEAIRLKATQTIAPDWALAQPADTLNEGDIHALMRTPEYYKNGYVHALVTNWYQTHYGPEQPVTDEKGNVIAPPDYEAYPPVPSEKPSQENAPSDDQGDAGDSNAEDGSGSEGESGGNDASDDGYDPDIFGDYDIPELGSIRHGGPPEARRMIGWDDEDGEGGAVLVRAYNRNAPKSGSNVQVQSYSRNRPGKRRI